MINNKFFENKEIIPVFGNTPLILNNNKYFYIVKKGDIDIFTLKNENGKLVGSKQYILSATSNEIIFNINNNKNDTDLVFLASGLPDTELFKIKISEIAKLMKDSELSEYLIKLINNWILKISISLKNILPPKKFIKVNNNVKNISKNITIFPSNTISWIKLIKGNLSYYGNDNLKIPENTYIPFTDNSWLYTYETCDVEIIDDFSLLKNFSISLIDNFHKISLNGLKLNVITNNNKELDRIKIKSNNDDLYFTNSLLKLTKIIEPDSSSIDYSKISSDPLFLASSLVGRSMGIKIIAPPPRTKSSRDPLNDIARFSHIRTRQILLSNNWWKKDNGAILAYIEETNKPVALIPKTPTKYVLIDPILKKEIKINKKIAETINPIAYSFYKPFPNKPLSALDVVLFGFKSCWKSDMLSIALLGIISGIFTLIIPLATGQVFDTMIPEADRNQLFQLCLALIVCAFANFMFKFTQSIALLRIEGKTDSTLQAAVWDRLLSLPVPFFRDYNAGDLSNRAMGINMIRRLLSGTVMGSVLSGIFSIFNLFLLFYYSKKLALWAVGLVIICVSIISIASYLRLKYEKILMTLEGKISGIVLQIVNGAAKFQIAGAEKRAFMLWANKFETQKKLDFKARSIGNFLETFNSIYPVICSVLIFYITMMIAKESSLASEATVKIKMLTTGQFLAFNAAFSAFLTAVMEISSSLISAINIIPLYERSKPILESVSEIDDGKADPGELNGSIEINHISFKYSEDSPMILKDISLEIKEGECVALVGSSGSGKSTLFRILLGFETPKAGSVYYDGQDLNTLNVQLVRQQLGTVLQSGRVTAGTIFTNIVGSYNLTVDDAWEAAKMAGFEDDVKSMPMGMHTVINEGGGTLSGGQRQRLLIARAIVSKPRIIFFDEATSALDNKTQDIVSKSLDNLSSTRIIIAHRLSTIINADKIFVLDKGIIKESGNYEELMKNDGLFAELARRQIA